MRRPEKDEGKFPACGYGLLGLCCSSCLLGPCRVSPFEKGSGKGRCGDTPDLLVAKNLFRLVAGEALEGLSPLKRAVERFSFLEAENTAKRRAWGRDRTGVIEKYGLPPRTTRKALSSYLFKESEKLLSPFSPKQPLFLKNLYPEKVFSTLYRHSFPPGSLTGFLFDSMRADSAESADVEKILWQCLQISMIKIICEELEKDINGIIDPEGPSQREKQALDALKAVSSNPSLVIIFVEDEKVDSKESIYRTTQKLKESIKGEILTLSIKTVGLLPGIGRRLYEEWALPVAEMKLIVLISSPFATWPLGALALGFNVISFPALSIHGSERVEKFFTDTLRKRFGNVYFLSWKENLLDEVLEFLRWKD